MRCLVLDAMGVLFDAADDVAELLVPCIAEGGGERAASRIESAYLAASLGSISPDEFWRRVGLDGSVEDSYLSKHALKCGVVDLLRYAKVQGMPVWCLSNDVERWSRKLRTMHDIETLLAGAVISSEAGVRKPNRGIYQRLLDRSGFMPSELLFIDDRTANVDAARAMGIPSVLFTDEDGHAGLIGRLFGYGSAPEQ